MAFAVYCVRSCLFHSQSKASPINPHTLSLELDFLITTIKSDVETLRSGDDFAFIETAKKEEEEAAVVTAGV